MPILVYTKPVFANTKSVIYISIGNYFRIITIKSAVKIGTWNSSMIISLKILPINFLFAYQNQKNII